MTRRRWPAAIVVGVLFLGVACGGTPTGDAGEGSAGGDQGSENPYESVFAELDELTGQERRDRLVELAEEEDVTVNVYSANTDLPDLAEEFTDEYGIEIDSYRARPPNVLERVLKEAQSGRVVPDLIDNNGYEIGIIADEGLTVDYEGPLEDELREGTDWDGWTANRFTITSPVWNKNALEGGPPTEFADMADSRFAGQLLLETNAFDWYMTLSAWFQENGMSEDEFDEMFLDIVRNATVVEGNTNHIQFLASGEYGISAGTFNHLADDAIEAGAPLERLPAIEPIIARPNGMGLSTSTDCPASTLLFFEWLLSDAQPLLVEEYRLPVVEGDEGKLLEGIDDLITIDVDQLVDEGEDWKERYDELLLEAAGTAEGEQ